MAFDSAIFHGTNKFPAAKYSTVGNYSKQKASLRDDRINQSWFENIWVQRYEVLINEIWQKRIQNGTSNFRIFVEIFPGIEKMEFFNWDCLSYYRSLSNSLICFLFVSQF